MAAAWALVLAAPHFCWGVDGTAGLDTALNRQIVEHRDGWFLVLNWGVGLLCVCGGVVALAAIRPCGRRVPTRLLRGLAWLGCGLVRGGQPFLKPHPALLMRTWRRRRCRPRLDRSSFV